MVLRHALAVLALLVSAAGAVPPPWHRTEVRAPCAAFDPLRQPLFGDLHIHTSFSADAYIFGTRIQPRDVYDYVRGLAAIPLSDDTEEQTRTAHIDRPLDFAAVTDHAEFFGETAVCTDAGSPAYDGEVCQLLRAAEPSAAAQFQATVAWLFPLGIASPPPRLPFCSTTPGVDCNGAAVSVWQEEQAAAEAAYDRTADCRFTSFVGYEYTPSPTGRHQHRNVIFRNEHVPALAYSFIETAAGGVPQGLWSAIESHCLGAGTGCDAVIIPHNSNMSDGITFADPADAADAARRQAREPLVEIFQQKAGSECRFDRLVGAGAGTADELCTFEQEPMASQVPQATPPPIDEYPRRNMVRNALKDGLVFEDRLGVNPFRLGFVGGTDTHNGTGGGVAEAGWPGGQGANDASGARKIANEIRTNPGGLTVVWAEENSRDAIFEALRRRETYATSGTRPVVRFFAGDLGGVACGDAGLVAAAYTTGVPMGGELGPLTGRRGPTFIVWAAKDPGSEGQPGTDLQRLQIVKGWVDRHGKAQEQVFDVAGDAANGAGVAPATCAPTGTGAAELCTTWTDPDFRRNQRAFYYARVLENPTCRWSTLVCRAAGVDPLAPDCATQAAAAGTAFANCCLGPGSDAFLEPVIQERAWTSPVWYRPDGIARVRGGVSSGAEPGSDILRLRIDVGRARALSLRKDDLTIQVADDGDILAATIPRTAWRRAGGKLVYRDRAAAPGALAKVSWAGRGKHPGVLRLATAPGDLGAVARVDHMVTVTLAAGTYRAAHARRWVATASAVGTGERD
jgi:hypothetical protein